MGGLCDEGHEFLRVCRKRNPEKTKHLIDVLVTQHSNWITGKIHRALFGQSSTSKVAASQPNLGSILVGRKPQRKCGHMRRLKTAFSNSEATATVGKDVVENGEIFLLST